MSMVFVQKNIPFLLSLGALALFALLPHVSFAYFSDEALSDGANFNAATLSVFASLSASTVDISSASPEVVTLSTSQTGAVPAQYKITATTTLSCTNDFYEGVIVHATDGSTTYDGPLSGFAATSSVFGLWDITFSASSTLYVAGGDACSISLITTFWQQNFPNPSSGGFTNTEVIPFTINAQNTVGTASIPDIVLNEIYPKSLSTTTAPLEREWVELYNNTSSPIDVANWAIGELSGTSTINEHEIVGMCPSSGVSKYAKPYGTADTVVSPGGFMVVEFCGTAGYLNDDGDTVSLHTSTTSGAVDSYTYSGDKPAGQSYARSTDGTGPWVDPIPTPGMPNELTAPVVPVVLSGSSEASSTFEVDSTTLVSATTTEATSTHSTSTTPVSPLYNGDTSSTTKLVQVNTNTSSSRWPVVPITGTSTLPQAVSSTKKEVVPDSTSTTSSNAVPELPTSSDTSTVPDASDAPSDVDSNNASSTNSV